MAFTKGNYTRIYLKIQEHNDTTRHRTDDGSGLRRKEGIRAPSQKAFVPSDERTDLTDLSREAT
jgi:hypothetical protein